MYIFNGDFMDRGRSSLENLLALCLFKLYCPECIHFTRGNHETRVALKTKVRDQVIDRYDEDIYKLVIEVVNELPVAIVLGGKYFVIHAGLINHNMTIAEMNQIERGADPGRFSVLTELLWADPQDEEGIGPVTKRGYYFGPDVSESFLEKHNLDIIIRGHEEYPRGSNICHDGRVITIWSAPTSEGSKGAYLNIDSNLQWKIEHFVASPTLSIIDDWSVL